jgi:hypothetical protein
MVELRLGQFGWNEVFFNGIGMNSVIDFYELAFDVPAELFLLFFFEPLEFLD